jgi:hypothetical protein
MDVAVEQLALGLAAVAHVRIGDRDASVFGNATLDTHAAPARVWLEVLADGRVLRDGGLRQHDLQK